ncbi:MAG TPA: hypothetical protein VN939_12595 [Chthoniobacterales bacterium]|nr:hypothetical protein [Chthoniobacterales bacterium]
MRKNNYLSSCQRDDIPGAGLKCDFFSLDTHPDHSPPEEDGFVNIDPNWQRVGD